jgi:hypothetical protein
MSYTSVYETDKVSETPAMVRNRSEAALPVTVSAYRRTDANSVRTYVILSQEALEAAGLRAGRRVSVLRGEGRDAGKIRIVANRNGSVKISNNLLVRTGRLLERTTSNRQAQVTGYAKGALTISL